MSKKTKRTTSKRKSRTPRNPWRISKVRTPLDKVRTML